MDTTATNPVVLAARRVWRYPASSRSDLIGITASLACVVRCLAAPFLLLLLLPSARGSPGGV